MIVSFFGHRDAPDSIRTDLKKAIEILIMNKDAKEFLLGNQGNFDRMVLDVIKEIKKEYPFIRYSVVLAYMPDKAHPCEKEETILPEGIETVPKKYAILWRNKWMIQNSHAVVCYVNRSWGGAAKAVDYAKKQHRKIVHLPIYTHSDLW